MAKAKDIERDEAIARLREWVKPGDTLHTILRHVSASGMTRHIDVYKLGADGEQTLTWNIAKAIGWPVNRGRHEGIVVSGAGMDMGFHVVNTLSYTLYPTYKCVGKRVEKGNTIWSRSCPSNEHINPGPERDNYSRKITHKDGYALRQRWL